MKSKSFALLMILLLLIPAFSTQAQDDTLNVGLVLPTFEEQYYLTIVDTAVTIAQDGEFNLSVMYSDYDAELELENVQSLIAGGIDALLLMPVDTTASAEAVEAANDAEIPVWLMAYELKATDDDDMTVAGLIAPNAETIGIDAATYICERLEDGGEVLELIDTELATDDDDMEMDEETTESEAVEEEMTPSQAEAISTAFNAELATNCEGIEIVRADVTDFEAEDDNSIVRAMMNTLGSESYAGVIGYELDTITNAANAVAASRTGAALFGFALGEDTLGAIEIGGLTAVVVAEPSSLANAAMDAVMDALIRNDRDNITVRTLVIDASVISTVRCSPSPCDP